MVTAPTNTPQGRAVIVGASLSGLCTALALARAGWSATVLERSTKTPAGMGLAVDMGLVHELTGIGRRRVPTIDDGYTFTGWGLLHAALLSDAAQHPRIAVDTGVTVLDVRDDDDRGEATVVTTTGAVTGDLVIGADGYNSVVRPVVALENATSTYSGFVLWRGIFEESELARGLDRQLGLRLENSGHDVLATFVVPGADGSIQSGRRRGVFTWFDAGSTGMLEAAGRIDHSHVVGTWHGKDVPTELHGELADRAGRWKSPWHGAIAASIRDRRFIGTPVAEYLPTRLATGRVALVGDAGHVVSPVTGAGFHNALLDIRTLARALDSEASSDVPRALAQYDRERLPLVRALVTESRSWSDHFSSARA